MVVDLVKSRNGRNWVGLAQSALPVFSSFAWLHTLSCMVDSTENPLELILRLCNAADPSPWYPSAYAKAAEIERSGLDPHLDRLRLANLIRLTDWVKGTGQGYVLTPAGKDLIANGRAMALLRTGNLQLETQPPPAEPLLSDEVSKKFARADAVIDVFDRRTPAHVTLVLVLANLAVFAYGYHLAQQAGIPGGQYLSPQDPKGGQKLDPKLADLYVVEGALTTDSLLQGQWWRLITSCFLHLGFMHLGMNLLVLYFIGPLTERMWGAGRYFLIYMLSGFGGACSMAYFDSPNSVGGGASGALYGLMAALIAWIVLNRSHMPRPFVNSMLQRLFAIVILNVFFSFAPGISMAAHIGGGVMGVIASLLMHGSLHGRTSVKFLSNLGVVLLPVVCFGALYQALRQDPKWEVYTFELRILPKLRAAQTRAYEILGKQWQPYLNGRQRNLSAQDLSKVVQAQREFIDTLNKGLDAAEQNAPYRDITLENDRRKIVNDFRQRIADVERKAWQRMIDPAVLDEARQATRFFHEQVDPLLAQPFAAREKETLVKTETELRDWTTRLTAMRELLDNLGPQVSDAGLEEARKEKMDHLKVLVDLLNLALAGLKQGSSWPAEERSRYDDLVEQFKLR